MMEELRAPSWTMNQEVTQTSQGVWAPFYTWDVTKYIPFEMMLKRRTHTKVSRLWYEVLNFGGVQTDGFYRFDEWLWEPTHVRR